MYTRYSLQTAIDRPAAQSNRLPSGLTREWFASTRGRATERRWPRPARGHAQFKPPTASLTPESFTKA